MLRWEQGRQGTGYRKMRLFQGARSDVYLLWFPQYSRVPLHQDPVAGKSHLRLNITLWKAGAGGEFVGEPAYRFGRFTLFRPDLVWHALTTVSQGDLFMLSIGVAL